jgi:ABC-type dipeptide/oligopeptide/nickel transport system ATPase component
MKITEQDNDLPLAKPVKEHMSIFIDGVNSNIPNRNGFIYALIGSPGSGKSSLLLSLFRDKEYYKKKFCNVYLITPESSFLSVKNHPFANHGKIEHELTEDLLEDIYDELLQNKQACLDGGFPLENSCVIIDDFASELKNKSLIRILKKVLTKSRHIGCSFIFTLQAYNLFPLVLRKMITNVSLFKPKNRIELESIRRELIGMKENDAIELMDYIFDEPYVHMDIDTGSSEIRKNFKLLKIEN